MAKYQQEFSEHAPLPCLLRFFTNEAKQVKIRQYNILCLFLQYNIVLFSH